MQRAVLAVMGLALTTACGGMSKEDANKAFVAMSGSLSQSTGAAQAETSSALVVDHSIDFVHDCFSGGTVHLVGTLHADDNDGAGGGDWAFDYNAEFDECSGIMNNIKTSGDIDHSLSITGDGTGVGSLAWKYKGNLTFSGEVEGDCEIDLTWNLSGVEGQSASSVFEGEICGHEVSSSTSFQR